MNFSVVGSRLKRVGLSPRLTGKEVVLMLGGCESVKIRLSPFSSLRIE